MILTLTATLPLGLSAASNSTVCPARSFLKPSIRIRADALLLPERPSVGPSGW